MTKKKYTLAFFKIYDSPPTTNDIIDVEIFKTYSLVKQINEDNINPEYETILEIDHHNDETYQNKSHELSDADLEKFIDILFTKEEIQDMLNKNNISKEEAENILYDAKEKIRSEYRNSQYKQIWSDLDFEIEKERQTIKEKLDNILETCEEASSFFDGDGNSYDYKVFNNVISNLKYEHKINFKNEFPDGNYYGYGFETQISSTSHFSYVIKNNIKQPWKEILGQVQTNQPFFDYMNQKNDNLETELPYHIMVSHTAIQNEIQFNYNSNENNGKFQYMDPISSSYALTYDSRYNIDNKWTDDSSFLISGIEKCFYFLQTARNSSAFHDLNRYLFRSNILYINGKIPNEQRAEYEWLSFSKSMFYNLGSAFRSLNAINNKKISIHTNIKNDKNIIIDEIFNVNNYINNSISDENKFGLFNFKNKTYRLNFCSNALLYEKLNVKFPAKTYSNDDNNGLTFIENSDDLELTYYDIYKISLENKLDSLFKIILDYIINNDDVLPLLINILSERTSQDIKIPKLNDFNFEKVDSKTSTAEALNRILKNENKSLEILMNKFDNLFTISPFIYGESNEIITEDPDPDLINTYTIESYDLLFK
jgi:hypothetical protein